MEATSELTTSKPTTSKLATAELAQTIAASDRLDAHSASALRSKIEDAHQSNKFELIVDLAAVSFVDSAGLAALVSGMKTCRSNGGDLKLVRPADPAAYRVFELTKFDLVFDFVEA